MGQRHQVFLVARLRPLTGSPSYRCVGAFHHQWCFGTLPLRATYRFIALLQQKENAAVVRGELRDLDGRYERISKLPATPCPYTTALLGIAWTTDLEDKERVYLSGNSLEDSILDVNIGCWSINNDDGLTIIDITGPERPAYCFIHPDYDGEPLTAYEYLSQYHDLAQLGQKVHVDEGDGRLVTQVEHYDQLLKHILRLAGYPLLSAASLSESWPEESFSDRGGDIPVVPSERDEESVMLMVALASMKAPDEEAFHLLGSEEAMRQANALVSTLKPSVKSSHNIRERWQTITCFLQHSSNFDFVFDPSDSESPSPLDNLQAAITRYLDTHTRCRPGDADCEKDMKTILAMPSHTKAILRNMSPFPPHALDLLRSILAETDSDHFLDLSGFDLCREQLVRILSCLSDTQSLDLSSSPCISAECIPIVLTSCPNLLRLIVMDCPRIDGNRLRELIREQPGAFRRVEGILHPSLLPVTKAHDFPISFTLIYANAQQLHGVSLPFFTPTLVLQALSTLLPMAWREQHLWFAHRRFGMDSAAMAPYSGGSFNLSAAMLSYTLFTTGTLPAGAQWLVRPVVSVPLQPRAVVSDHLGGSWAFFINWAPDQGRAQWGFIHYAPDGCASSSHRRGKVYDLHGFLRCMVDEGRPLPDDDLVQRLEGLLSARHNADGVPICPLMDDEDVPELPMWVPGATQGGYMARRVPHWMERPDVTGALQLVMADMFAQRNGEHDGTPA